MNFRLLLLEASFSPAVIALSTGSSTLLPPAVVRGFQVSFMREAPKLLAAISQPAATSVYFCEGFWQLFLELVFRRNSGVALQVP